MTKKVTPGRRLSEESGFSIVETMIATLILLIVCGTVMQGVLGLAGVNRTVSNRTDMHNAVRNATELLTQEVGQAGRVTLPGRVTLVAGTAAGAVTLTLESDATEDGTEGMFVGELLVVDTGALRETVTVTALAADTVTVTPALTLVHAAGVPVSALGGFAAGVIPESPGYANGSTGEKLKIFGDIHGDGNLVYVEYTCDFETGRLYRNSMPFDAGAKPAPTVEQVLIDNIERNPVDASGVEAPCFDYQSKVVNGVTYVIDVAITLTVRTTNVDVNTGDFQRETKALLNVSPRNVFNVWQMASLQYEDRIQPTPASVTALLADQ